MKNILIVLLTAAIVVTGAFLPQLLMRGNSEPDLKLDYQQVSITPESASDYAWRMAQIAEHYYGDGDRQLTTYIGKNVYEEEDTAAERFLQELEVLTESRIVPPELIEWLRENPEYRISYYYIYDEEAANSFRVAEFQCSADKLSVTLAMDVQSGKLAKIEYSGTSLQLDNVYFPENFSSWYDVLRVYADYLGLSTSALAIPDVKPVEGGNTVRQYYEDATADKLAAHLTTGGEAWLELRVLRDPYSVAIAVYRGES